MYLSLPFALWSISHCTDIAHTYIYVCFQKTSYVKNTMTMLTSTRVEMVYRPSITIKKVLPLSLSRRHVNRSRLICIFSESIYCCSFSEILGKFVSKQWKSYNDRYIQIDSDELVSSIYKWMLILLPHLIQKYPYLLDTQIYLTKCKRFNSILDFLIANEMSICQS